MKRGYVQKALWLAMAVTASFMVACAKKGGGGSTATTPVSPFGACGSCAFTQGVMMTANTSWQNVLNFNIRLVGDATQMAAQGAGSYNKYKGPVMIDGTLTVTAAQFEGNCVIPAGVYNLITVQPGQMDWTGSFTVPQFSATGPTSVLFKLTQASSIGSYYGGVGRIYGQLDVVQAPDRTTGAIVACTSSGWSYNQGFFLN